MNKIWLYGAGNVGTKIYEKILPNDEKAEFAGFIDSKKYGQSINGYKIVKIEDVPKDDIIIIAVKSSEMIVQIYDSLRKLRYKNIFLYNANEKLKIKKTNLLQDYCINCCDWGDIVLPQAEIHVSDYCNLNCRGCTHYSPIFDRILPNTKERIHDIKLLALKFSHVVDFYLLGGEPFLNPDIEEYILSAYTLLPNSRIHIVTNGLLLPKIPEKIFTTIRKYDVDISISEYKPTHDRIDEIKMVLDKNNIKYDIRPFDQKQLFNKPLTKMCNTDYEKLCISNGCVNIWNGKIARCPSLMYVQELNAKFGLNLPSDGIYSLEDKMPGERLKELLKEEVPLCSYCVKNPIEWSCCGANPVATDFVETD